MQERSADLNTTAAQLEEAPGTQQALLGALREAPTPVIPVARGVLAMPLIGQLDHERQHNATRTLLSHIARTRARVVLLDLTGVPLVDAQVSGDLLQTVAAARMLGTRVILVGITPEAAQTMASFGMDPGHLHTSGDLQSAIAQVRAPVARSHG